MRPRVWAPRGRSHLRFRPNSHHHKAIWGLFAMPISLSQPQFLAVANAAAALYPGDRDAFVAAVAAALEGVRPIGDGSVARAIAAVQCRFDHPEPTPAPARWERDRPDFERASKRAY
jgi:hypothetical protein